jgi:hypothetical protein
MCHSLRISYAPNQIHLPPTPPPESYQTTIQYHSPHSATVLHYHLSHATSHIRVIQSIPSPLLHIIFVTPMTINYVNLSFVFRRIMAWITEEEWRYIWPKRWYYNFLLPKTLEKGFVTPFLVLRVWWYRIFTGCIIVAYDTVVVCWVLRVRRFSYKRKRGISRKFLNRSFEGEVASDRFGFESHPRYLHIILTTSPYPFHPLKWEAFSWGKLDWVG